MASCSPPLQVSPARPYALHWSSVESSRSRAGDSATSHTVPFAARVAVSARQPPRSGPPVYLLADALAMPLPRTRSPSPVVATGFAHQLPHAGPPAKLHAAVLPPPPLCPKSLSTASAPSFAPQSPSAGPPVTLLVDAPVKHSLSLHLVDIFLESFIFPPTIFQLIRATVSCLSNKSL